MHIGTSLRRTLGVTTIAAALGVMFAGPASAIDYPSAVQVNPDDYRTGDNVYFDLGYGQNCVIRSNGDIGCDFPQGLTVTVPGLPFRPTLNDLAIDISWLPAHPEFHQQGRSGSKVLRSPYETGGGVTITYAGASCSTGGFHGSWICKSKGHSFGGGGGYNNIS